MKTRLAAVLVAALSATAHADGAINLSLHGSVDADDLGRRLATELSRDLSVAGDRCAAPCLTITVAEGSATVLYTDASGSTRARTVELGRDRAQWPTLITLLAGNLVRDEAATLLADAPVDAAPPDDAAPTDGPVLAPVVPVVPLVPGVPAIVAPPVEAPVRPRSLIGLGLLPGLSTDLSDFNQPHVLSIGLVSAATSNDLVQITGAVGFAGGKTRAQFAGAFAFADEADTQIAGAAAFADRSHFQVAGAAAFADHAETQLAGAIAIADHSAFQAAGSLAISDTAHVQVAGAMSIADTANVQISGAMSIADNANTQISGAMNIADHVKGVQIAPINIADRVDGLQVGVINFGGGENNEAIGLINIVPGGRTDLEGDVTSDRLGTLTFRHGGRHFHNVYGLGGQYNSGDEKDKVWMFGLGLGGSFHVASLPVDLDAMAWQVQHDTNFGDHVSLLNQLRLTVAVPVGPVALTVGAALNVYVTDDQKNPLYLERTTDPMPTTISTTVKLWPSVFVGARI